jgi:pimeloyl-ACP methyl ester carboxylesterase
MAYKEWGDADNPRVLLCVHGVTRVSDDFDAMAQALAADYRVIAPDIVGRGRSGRLLNPSYTGFPNMLATSSPCWRAFCPIMVQPRWTGSAPRWAV